MATVGMEICTEVARKEGPASRLRETKAIVGTVAKGRPGLGYNSSTQILKAGSKDLHLHAEVRAGMKEAGFRSICRFRSARNMDQIGNVTTEKTWADYWRPDMNSITFLLQAVYDTLPCPANVPI